MVLASNSPSSNDFILQSSPVYRKPYRAALVELSAFFEPENPELLE